MEKRRLLDAVIAKLQAEVDALERAAKAAHEAATHEESRAEDRHDTRGLEASYLAGAQAQRAAELRTQISVYRMMPLPAPAEGTTIGPGALVALRLEDDGSVSHYLVVPRGGGTLVTVDGVTVQVVAPLSPLGEALIGRRAGDAIEVEARDRVREYEVVSVS